MKAPIDNDPHPQSGPDQQVHEGPEAGPPSCGQLAQRCQVGVVGDGGPVAELASQSVEEPGPAPPAESGGEQQGPVARVEHPGAAHHGPGHLRPLHPSAAGHVAGQGAHHPDQVGSAASGVPEVAASHHRATQVGHRAAQPAMADVDADHVPVPRDLFEEQGGAPAPLTAGPHRAHQAGAFQCHQYRPHRGLRQACLLGQPRPRGGPAATESLQDCSLVEAAHQLGPGVRPAAPRRRA